MIVKVRTRRSMGLVGLQVQTISIRTQSVYGAFQDGSVFDLNGNSLPNMMNDHCFGGNACLDLSDVNYYWQLCIQDYRFINIPLVTYTVTNSDGSLYDSGTYYLTEDTTMSLTMNSLMNYHNNELNSRCTAMASCFATDDDSLIQHIDN